MAYTFTRYLLSLTNNSIFEIYVRLLNFFCTHHWYGISMNFKSFWFLVELPNCFSEYFAVFASIFFKVHVYFPCKI